MNLSDIELSVHAIMQMQRRRITLKDIALVLQLGEHVYGRENGTMEACALLDGRPITVVYEFYTAPA